MSIDPKSSYYDHGGSPTIDHMRAKLSPEEFRGWLRGEMYTHLDRLYLKDDPARDAEKLAVYAALLRDELIGSPPERSAAVEARHGKSAWETHPTPDAEVEALDIMAATNVLAGDRVDAAAMAAMFEDDADALDIMAAADAEARRRREPPFSLFPEKKTSRIQGYCPDGNVCQVLRESAGLRSCEPHQCELLTPKTQVSP